MNAKLKELREKLAKAQADMKKVFDQAGEDMDFSKVTEIAGTTAEKCAALRKMNEKAAEYAAEIKGLSATQDELAAERKAYEERNGILSVTHPVEGEHKAGDEPETKGGRIVRVDFKDAIVKSGILKKENRHKEFELPAGVSLKTLFSSSSWAPESLRTGKVIEYPVEQNDLLSIIPIGQTDEAVVKYMQVTTRTNSALEIKEGDTDAAYASNEAAFVVEEQSSTVRKIMVYIPVTEEQLADEKQSGPFLDRELRSMLNERLVYQIINGNGTAPNLSGILDQATLQSVNKSDNANDLVTDVLFRMVTEIRVDAKKVASNFVLHPYDWQTVKLMKTNDGLYIWGHPSTPGPQTIWGLPVISTTDIAQYKALAGDFRTSIELTEREGILIKASDGFSDYFLKGKLAVRGTVRVALPIYRPAAFCEGNLNS